MRRLLLIIGLLAVARPAFAESGETLYTRIRAAVSDEVNTQTSELAVERFAAGAYYDHVVETSVKDDSGGPDTTEDFPVLGKDVDLALQKAKLELCGEKHNMPGPCFEVQTILEALVKRATWVRSLGRKLQTIASGYEAAMYGYPGGMIDISLRLASIPTLWRAGNDPFVTPIVPSYIRALALPNKDTTEQKIKDVISSMKSDLIRTKGTKKDDTDFIAAVWRYRNGVKYVKYREGDCSAGTPPTKPDRTNDERRFCQIEDKLIEIHDQIMAAVTIDPPKQSQEQVLFPSVIDKKLNVMVWIRDDDIGLEFVVATTPMQVSLFKPSYSDCVDGDDNPEDCDPEHSLILGGNYPASLDGSGSRVQEPKENEGLCSHPFSRRGYLCRPIESEACDLSAEDKEKVKSAASSSSSSSKGISLTECAPERFIDDVARRVSGSDVCGIGGWRGTIDENVVKDDHTLQLDMKPNSCAACAIDVHCEDECDGQTGYALTKITKANGVIRICMPRKFDDTGNVEYLLAHEIVHAEQACQQSDLQSVERIGQLSDADGDGELNEAERKQAAAACCALEREAYFAQCQMMAQDGILDLIGFTIDQCGSDFANSSCKGLGEVKDGKKLNACTNDGVNFDTFFDMLQDALKKKKATLTAPKTCDAFVDNPTARVKAMYDSVPMTCSPGCQSKFANTIGNNLCYTGQCVEQTHEFARPIPGRTPLTENDQAFPFDSCELPDPKIAAVAAPPALTGPKLPVYNPAQLLTELDTELCQMNGLPARTPPVICGFDPSRRIILPLMTGVESVDSLHQQPAEFAVANFGLQEAGASLGAMRVNDMYDQYLRPAARQFADLLDMARTTLATLGKTPFPAAMCPRTVDGNDLCKDMKAPPSSETASP